MMVAMILGFALVVGVAYFLLFSTGRWQGGQPIELTSKLEVSFLDRADHANEVGQDVTRFRFIAPAISRGAGKLTFEDVEADMQSLCRRSLQQFGRVLPAQIVVVLMDRPHEFGARNPDVTQFFEVYRPVNNQCIWEGL